MYHSSVKIKILILITVLFIASCGDSKTETAKLDQIDKSLCQFIDGSCKKEANGVEIALLISPNNVPSGQNLNLNITSNELIKIKSARVEGRDMFMGRIPLQFNTLKSKDFSSDMILGSCASGYMVWRLFITFEKKGIESTVFFDFLADNA